MQENLFPKKTRHPIEHYPRNGELIEEEGKIKQTIKVSKNNGSSDLNGRWVYISSKKITNPQRGDPSALSYDECLKLIASSRRPRAARRKKTVKESQRNEPQRLRDPTSVAPLTNGLDERTPLRKITNRVRWKQKHLKTLW